MKIDSETYLQRNTVGLICFSLKRIAGISALIVERDFSYAMVFTNETTGFVFITQGAIYLVIFGFSFSTIAFIVEFVMGRSKKVTKTTQTVLNELFVRVQQIKDSKGKKNKNGELFPQTSATKIVCARRRHRKEAVTFTYLK